MDQLQIVQQRIQNLRQSVIEVSQGIVEDIDVLIKDVAQLGGTPVPPEPPKGLSPFRSDVQLSTSYVSLRVSASLPIVPPAGEKYLAIKYFFTTRDGKWTPNVDEYGIEPWALELFNESVFIEKGSAQSLFGCVLDASGNRIRSSGCRFQSNVTNDFRAMNYQSGWANNPIWNFYDPKFGDPKAWTWYPEGFGLPAARLHCGGLPNKWHVSYFGVWQVTQA